MRRGNEELNRIIDKVAEEVRESKKEGKRISDQVLTIAEAVC